jgi:hypothetical protein
MAIIERRRAPLFLFFLPFVVSECSVRIAGVFHGRLSAQATVVPVCIFAFVQIALVAYIAYGLKAAKLAGWALTVFSLSYAAFAYFTGQMSWTDTFL